MDPTVLAMITAAVSVLGSEYIKGVGSEVGKATWTGIKSILGWTEDPNPADIPDRVATELVPTIPQ
jgi:hypothetical protein